MNFQTSSSSYMDNGIDNNSNDAAATINYDNNDVSTIVDKEPTLSEKEKIMIINGYTEEMYWKVVNSACLPKPKDIESYERPAREEYCKKLSEIYSKEMKEKWAHMHKLGFINEYANEESQRKF